MKKIVILVLILLLTGCSARYHVTINKDLTINEYATVKGSENIYSTYYRTTKYNVLNNLLNNYIDQLKEKGYTYEIFDVENPYVTLNKTYQDFNEYLDNSLLFNNYFDKINYSQEDNIIKIETEGFHPNNPDDPGRFYLEEVDIMVTPSFKVINSNATKIDEKTNTYHFIIERDSKDFKILLEMDTGRIFDKDYNMKMIIIVSILIIIGTWVIFIINRKKKNN